MDNKATDRPPAYNSARQWEQPQQQQQPDTQYRQGQQYPGQQPYGQQQYGQQPSAPATTVVVVNQPPPVTQDYTFPRGVVPSIVLLVGAGANLLCWIIVGAVTHLWLGTEWLAAFIFYIIAGVLGAVGSFQTQNHEGIAIGTIVMSAIAMIVAFAQFVQEFKSVAAYGVSSTWQWIIMGLIGLAAFIACIILIVVASQVVCGCCKRRQQ